MSKQQLQIKFEGRKLVIATKHKKETVIAPVFKSELGVNCFTAENLDTDLLGTFTGEVERNDSPLETVKKKCYLAMALTNCDMAIASEGSFGPHPTLGFINADDEILMFIDKKNNLEIWVRELSVDTNFNGQEVTTIKQLIEFSESAKFPEHALIIRKSKTETAEMIKGITDLATLKSSFLNLHYKYGSAYVETDMRAQYNPTRMHVIKNAVKKLITKIKTHCPKCYAPGFSVAEAKPGLKCENCGLPTRSTLLHILSCKCCGFTQEVMNPHGRFSEDPMYCDICNP